MKSKQVKCRCWNGRTFYEYTGKLMPFKNGCQLFYSRSARKWWLYYGKDNMTGSFPCKQDAIYWYEHGGR